MGELTHLFEVFAMESTVEVLALKAAMILPPLLLQKPHPKSKTKDHIACLKHRFVLWEMGDLTELLIEGNQFKDFYRILR